MRLNNIRLGHATNSSSSHSILILNHEYADIPEGYAVADGQYGWSQFVLADKESKQKYVYGMLLSSVLHGQPTYLKKIIGKDIFGIDVTDDMLEYYVDHQSVPDFPTMYGKPDALDWDFINALKEALLKDNVVILGGNDNDGDEEFVDYHPRYRLQNLWEYGDTVSRYDPKGYWTLFNRRTGTKIRLDLNQWQVEGNVKLTGPELIDLKLTDYCPFDCPFCYQGSTTKGVHAKLNFYDVYSLVETFKHMGVLEVAIGGGEPTFHPDFPRLVRHLNEAGINANFTTRSTHWLDNKEIWDNIAKFAFSVETIEQIKNIQAELQSRNLKDNKLNIHIVMGTVEKKAFRELLQYCYNERLSVTLLGYKYVERGNEYTPVNYDWWYDVVHSIYKGSYYRHIAVDTAMIQQYGDLIRRVASQKTYHVTEGSHSLYIDLVARQIAASSYSKNKVQFQDFSDIPILFENVVVE